MDNETKAFSGECRNECEETCAVEDRRPTFFDSAEKLLCGIEEHMRQANSEASQIHERTIEPHPMESGEQDDRKDSQPSSSAAKTLNKMQFILSYMSGLESKLREVNNAL